MKIHRFIGNFSITKNTVSLTDQELVHQILRVLKLRVGEKIIVSDGMGNEILGTIETILKTEVRLEIESKNTNLNEPQQFVTLYLSVLKKDNFELALQKAVECGISKIVPILTTRTIKQGLNEKRLQTILREAAEQSGRGIIPELTSVISFSEALSICNPKETILFDLSGTPLSTDSLLLTTNLFIGPEGGFETKEVEEARNIGVTIASLGKLTLRAETAAIITSYLFTHPQ